jgi:hypothetical protein
MRYMNSRRITRTTLLVALVIMFPTQRVIRTTTTNARAQGNAPCAIKQVTTRSHA